MRTVLSAAFIFGVAAAMTTPAWSDCQQAGNVVTCTGTAPNGFGNGTQDNLTVNVQSGATVIGSQPAGSPVGINLLDNNVVNNAGSIVTTGTGISVNNNNVIFNTGTINATGPSGIGILGIFNTTVTNTGTITAPGDGGAGIIVFDNSTVTNSGTITTGTNATGIVAEGPSTLIVNTGTITVGPGIASVGIQDNSGNNTIRNSGTIIVGDGGQGISSFDGTSVTNTGSIVVGAFIPGGNFTAGIAANANQTIINSGTISAGVNSEGILTFSGHNTIINNGKISVGANVGVPTSAIGINVFGEQNVITNAGTVTAGANAFGVALGSGATSFGGHTLINNGTIVVGANGVSLSSSSDFNVVTNAGTIDGQIKLLGASTTFTNSGLITITDPGTTMGVTHSIGGDYTQTSSGTLALRVDATPNHDTLAVSGTAALAGTLRAIVQPGLYGATTSYLGVLTAGNAINTQFAQATSSSPFFTAAAIYHPTTVDLTLTRIAFGSAPGQTRNELAVSRALDPVYSTSLTGNAATFFGNLLAATSVGVFDQLSGEGTSATQNTAISADGMFLSTLMDQLWLWRGGDRPGVVDTAAMPPGYAAESREKPIFNAIFKAPPAYLPSWHVWATGFGGAQSFKGDATIGSANASDHTGGGAFGVDYQFKPDLLLGVGVGASTSSFSVPDRATSGTVDGGHVGFYGMQRWGSAYAAGLISYSRFDNSTTRTITGVGPTEIAAGSFASDLLGARLEVGRTWAYGYVRLTPFAAVQVSELWQRGYSESSTIGGAPGILGLAFAPIAVTSLPTFLGAQVDTRAVLDNGMVWSPFARAAWVHEFRPTRQITAAFLSVPGAGFSVDGARAASDSLKLDVGSRLALNRMMDFTATFTGEFSDRTQSYAGRAGLRISF
jgi:uncharacterized protein with beta-barrel porin domain